MGKLLVLYILIPFYLKFRYRKNSRIQRRVERWFLLFTATLLLLVAPWDIHDGSAGSALLWVRLAAALGFFAFLLYDIRKTTRPAEPR